MSDTPTTTSTTTALYCENHPQVETTLRCNRCDKPICARCAVLTPTGYRCRECVRGQQKIFNTAQWYDYFLATVLAGVLSFAGSLIVPRLGFFTIFLAPVAGVIIGETIRLVIQRRRSKTLFQLTALAVAVGSLPPLLIILISALGGSGLGILLPLIWHGLYSVTVTSTVYYRLGGIRL